MSLYKRYYVPGGTYFFTLVTEGRSPLFACENARQILARKLRECQERHPFTMVAIVLLPDHLHMLWSLPQNDTRYSARLSWLKGYFTREWLLSGGHEQSREGSRNPERRRGVWQRRFWEHTIRDEADLESHADYIHYNPVKHGYAKAPCDWEWSSFHRFVAAGQYERNWGKYKTPPNLPMDAGE